jgi:hypothetical protein
LQHVLRRQASQPVLTANEEQLLRVVHEDYLSGSKQVSLSFGRQGNQTNNGQQHEQTNHPGLDFRVRLQSWDRI